LEDPCGAAVSAVAPDESGYALGLDWRDLTCEMFTWAGDYPGKIGVNHTVTGWFSLKGITLELIKAEYEDESKGVRRHWP
jgi:hypothetical protein